MYIRYPLSLRHLEDLLYERGIDICHETVRLWWNRFAPALAAKIRKKRISYPKKYSNWRWHIDEVFVKIGGKTHYLCRAVDHEGEVLDAVVTKQRDKKAALKVLKSLIKRYGRPTVIVTDKLVSYKAAIQKFTSIHSQIYNHFNGERHLVKRQTFKEFRSESMTEWRSLTA